MLFDVSEKSLEEKVLIEINRLFSEEVYPSIGKIAKNLNMEKSLLSIQIALDKLTKKGFIKKNHIWKIENITENGLMFLNQWNYKLKNFLKTVSIPICWSISCWKKKFAYEEVTWYVDLSESIQRWINSQDYFILTADGDSMNQIGINDGDMLLIKKQNYAKNEDIVLALVSFESALLKEFRQNDLWYVQLIPRSTNKEHKTIVVNSDEVLIQWIYIKNLWNFNY